MAWEWVGPTAVGAVGMTGIIFTWLTGKQAREHAASLAKEERVQRRLEETYLALLDMAERMGQWAQMVRPMMDTIPPQSVPPLPGLPEQANVSGRVGVFGSEDVRSKMRAWLAVVREMISNDGLIELERMDAESGKRPDYDWGKPRREIGELRPRERDARQALTDQVASELGHRTA